MSSSRSSETRRINDPGRGDLDRNTIDNEATDPRYPSVRERQDYLDLLGLLSHSALYIPVRRDDAGSRNLLRWIEERNIRLDAIQIVAFYAWSPTEVNQILRELQERCPNLRHIYIGITTRYINRHGEVRTYRTKHKIQQVLWGGVDYPTCQDRLDEPGRVVPDLDEFTRIIKGGRDKSPNHFLQHGVLPQIDPWDFGSRCENLVLPLNTPWNMQFFCPVIDVVEVPLRSPTGLPNTENMIRFMSADKPWWEAPGHRRDGQRPSR